MKEIEREEHIILISIKGKSSHEFRKIQDSRNEELTS